MAQKDSSNRHSIFWCLRWSNMESFFCGWSGDAGKGTYSTTKHWHIFGKYIPSYFFSVQYPKRYHKSSCCGHLWGGEWYPENSGSRKFLFQSRNLGGVLNESRNLVFLCFFASRILEFLAARSRSSESRIFVFLANGFDQNHDKIVYLIKNVR